MTARIKQTKVLENFYEKLLFNIFVDCVVVKNTEIFDYSRIKTIQQSKSLPLQIASLIERYNKGDTLDKERSDVKNFFTLYMNFKHIFQLEYFEDKLQKWILLDNDKLASFKGKLLCRVIPYINEKLGVVHNNDIQFSIVNQYFILGE